MVVRALQVETTLRARATLMMVQDSRMKRFQPTTSPMVLVLLGRHLPGWRMLAGPGRDHHDLLALLLHWTCWMVLPR